MSMDTHVVGFIPPDETWQRMKAVYDACVAGNVTVPEEVEEFFGDDGPDSAGRAVKLDFREWKDDFSAAGIEVDVDSLPPHVKTIRFFNSW